VISRERGRYIFDEVAALYDEARPFYPSELVDDIVLLSGIPPSGRILEVGCGTGQATVPFAKAGYSMLCLEPGRNLAALARQNVRAYANVKVMVVSFEDWPVEERAFDLVVFADSFRWIGHETGYSKSAKALKDSGAIAIFRNTSPYEESQFRRELDLLYEEHVSKQAEGARKKPVEGAVDERERDMNRTGLFEKMIVRRYPWAAQYDAACYVKLLSTYSDHRCLPETTRQNLLEAIRALIERHGGTFTKPYVAVLHLAKKRRVDT
jgi:SAM-dependent methyltransferase